MTSHRLDERSHFVMKRGHLGRYRFTLIMDEARLTGEVKTGNAWEDRAKQDRYAYTEIARIAATLAVRAAEVETDDEHRESADQLTVNRSGTRTATEDVPA